MTTTPRSPGRWAVGLLGAFTLLFFASAVLGDGQFFYRDVSQNHYPMRVLEVSQFARGLFPLWNPHLTFGQPLLANPNYMVLHPTTLLFAVLPFGAAFRWGIVLQYFLGAVGTYALMRDQGIARPAAWLAGIAFAFSGPFVSLGNLYNVLGTVAWFPAAVWLLRRAALRGGLGWSLAAAGALAVQIHAAEPLTILATLVFGFLFATRVGPPVDGASESGAAETPWIRRLLRLGIVFAWALVLGSIQILATMELMPLSERGAGFGYELASKWSTHPLRLVELLVAGWFGNPADPTPLLWWGEGFFESSLPFLLGLYVGGPVLLLAIVALTRLGRDRLVRLLAVAGGLSLLLALGRHGGLYGLLYRLIPDFDRFRYPSKFMLLFAFAVACLAGVGLDRLMRREVRRIWVWIGGAVLTLLPAAGWLVLSLAPGWGADLLHGPMGASGGLGGPRDAIVVASLARACARAAGVSAAATALAWGLATGHLSRYRPALLMAALVAADLYAANGGLNPTVDPSWYGVRPTLVDEVREGEGEERIYRHPRPDGFAVRLRDGASASSTGFLWDRVSLRNVTGLQYGLFFGYDRNNERLNPGPSAYVSLRMEAEYDLDEKVRTWQLGSVRYILAYDELLHPQLTLLRTIEGDTTHPLLLYAVEGTLARARVVGAVERADRRDDALDRLRSAGFDARGTVLLPGPAGALEGEPAAAPAHIVVDEPHRVEIVTEAPFPGWLVLHDTYFPGWEAEIDGEPATIEPAYLLFRAVRLTAGAHRVTFRYRPRPVRVGVVLVALGLAVPLGAAGYRRLRRRRSEAA